MSGSNDWFGSGDKIVKKEERGIPGLNGNIGTNPGDFLKDFEEIPGSTLPVECQEKKVLLEKNSFPSSCSSLSSSPSSSSTSSEISSTSKDLSDDEGRPANEADVVENRPIGADDDVESSAGCISNFKAFLSLINLNRFVNNSRNLLSGNSKATTSYKRRSLSISSSSSSSASLESSSQSSRFSSSSCTKGSSIGNSSSVSTSSEERQVVPAELPSISNLTGEILDDSEISQETIVESSLEVPAGTNTNEVNNLEIKQPLKITCELEETVARKNEEIQFDKRPTHEQNRIDNSAPNENKFENQDDIPEKEPIDSNSCLQCTLVPTDNKEQVSDINLEIVDKSVEHPTESNLETANFQADEGADMATRNYSNGYNLIRDPKDSLGSLTTKHLLLDYLHGSDIFNKSHLLAPKSLKTYVPPSLSRYNDTSNYPTSGPSLKDSLGASTKSDNITVPPTSKYIKYADRIALKNASKNEKINFSKSLDEQSLKVWLSILKRDSTS